MSVAISSTKPDAWTLSPQATAAPELWRGALAVTPLWEGVGAPGVIGNKCFALQLKNAMWGLGQQGARLEGDASSEAFAITNQFPDVGGTGWTFIVSATSRVSQQQYYAPLMANGNPGGERQFKLLLQDDGSGTGKIRAQIGDGSVGVKTNGFGYFAGARFIIAVSYDGETLNFYKNGDIFDSVSSSISTYKTSEFSLLGAFGDGEPGEPLEWAGSVDWSFSFNEALKEEQIKLISRDPFAMLRPAGF